MTTAKPTIRNEPARQIIEAMADILWLSTLGLLLRLAPEHINYHVAMLGDAVYPPARFRVLAA